MVPTTVPVQPAPLYEALVAFAQGRVVGSGADQPVVVVSACLIGAGVARFLIEFARENTPSRYAM
jgi:prolipoprotein diacylglyceryltransferase